MVVGTDVWQSGEGKEVWLVVSEGGCLWWVWECFEPTHTQTDRSSYINGQASYRAATLLMIFSKEKASHSSNEMEPSPFSSILANMAFLSSADWKGTSMPNLF